MPIVGLFLVGVALQVINTTLNKWAAWYMYRGLEDTEFKKRRFYAAASWYSEQFWVDMLCDFAAMAAFFWATLKTVAVVGL